MKQCNRVVYVGSRATIYKPSSRYHTCSPSCLNACCECFQIGVTEVQCRLDMAGVYSVQSVVIPPHTMNRADVWTPYRANTGHSPNSVSMLRQCRRRWANIETALGECQVFSVICCPLNNTHKMTGTELTLPFVDSCRESTVQKKEI